MKYKGEVSHCTLKHLSILAKTRIQICVLYSTGRPWTRRELKLEGLCRGKVAGAAAFCSPTGPLESAALLEGVGFSQEIQGAKLSSVCRHKHFRSRVQTDALISVENNGTPNKSNGRGSIGHAQDTVERARE